MKDYLIHKIVLKKSEQGISLLNTGSSSSSKYVKDSNIFI